MNEIDQIYDMFDLYMQNDKTLIVALTMSILFLNRLETDEILALLTATLSRKSYEPRAVFAQHASEVLSKRHPEEYEELIKGLL